MQFRQLTTMFIVLALTACLSQRASAHEDREGKVVKAGGGKLTISVRDDNKEHVFDVAKDAKITLNGKTVKLEELKAGSFATVTIHDLEIITIDARLATVGRLLVPEAVVVSYEKQDLVIKVGIKEHTIKIGDNVKVFDAEGYHLTDKQIEEALKKDAKVEIRLNGRMHEVKIKK